MAGQLAPVRQGEDAVGSLGSDLHDLLRSEDLRTQTSRLCDGAACQIVPTETRWKAQIVLDSRTEAGLSARGLSLHNNCLEPFRGAVNSGCQPGRPSSHNHQIEKISL